MAVSKDYKGRNTWLELGAGYSDPVKPANFSKKTLRYRNNRAAQSVGLDELTDSEWLAHFGDFSPLPNNLDEALALRYHGHQFTHYNPQLGDGRGFLFAQLEEINNQTLLDLGTKGSGQTPYSRQGDGRLTLKGAVREALATAYLEFHGVNTSKTFSIIETHEKLDRHDEPSPTRSAVLVRLSKSHIRIGTFQRLAYFKETEKIEKLIQYTLKHYYPKESKLTFFKSVCENIAKTTAQWMIHGFVHGVLNTDNINITGESFDYGPYRFLPHYDLNFTAAYFDREGLYAYGRQPRMIMWNLERLKEALSSVYSDPSVFEEGFQAFQQVFESETFRLFSRKLGIDHDNNSLENIKGLFYLTLKFLDEQKVAYEQFFHDLYSWKHFNTPLSKYNSIALQDILEVYNKLKLSAHTSTTDPLVCQTLLIDEIEEIWAAIDTQDNWQPFYNKLTALTENHNKYY